MMFSVEPVAYRYMNAQTSDMGIVRQMMNVARQRPRNIITTSMTNMNAYMIVSPSEAMASVISCELSYMVRTSTSLGSVGMIFSILACTACTMSTVLDPDCFCTITRTPRRPLIRSSMVAFSSVSRISATSSSMTVRPPVFETTIWRSWSLAVNSPSALTLNVLLPMSIVPPGTLTFSAAMS